MSNILKSLNGFKTKSTPVWLMRQAGRYMSEYQAIKRKFSDFSEMCRNPDAVTEITLQPINKFDLDAAIIFSDILYIMDCLKVKVNFVKDEGPHLENNNLLKIIKEKKAYYNEEKLFPVYKAIRLTKRELSSRNIPLLGFVGGPWTLATYLIEGRLTKDHMQVRRFSYERPKEMRTLINLLSDIVVSHMINQIKYGVDALQIFDTHSNHMDHFTYKEYGINAVSKIARKVKNIYPRIPITLFTKSFSINHKKLYENIDCFSFSSNKDMNLYTKIIPKRICFQGNLDPMLLVVGGKEMEVKTKKILEQMKNKNFIFNLGHGVLKQTPTKHVHQLIEIIRRCEN